MWITIAGTVLVIVLAFALNLAGFAVDAAVSAAIPDVGPVLNRLIVTVVGIVALTVLAGLVGRYILRRTIPPVLDVLRLRGRALALGLAVGILVPGLLLLVLWVTGWGAFASDEQAPWPLGVAAALLVALLPAFAEELAYRYVLYGWLRTRMPRLAAALIAGVVFALVHVNQVSGGAEVALLIVGGVSVSLLFIALYEVTGSLVPGVIAHTLWNATVSETGFSVLTPFSSGDGFYRFGTVTVQDPALLASGGSFGVDASLLAIVLYLLGAAGVWFAGRRWIGTGLARAEGIGSHG